MRVLILGSGKLGSHLSTVLAMDGHTVTVMDSDSERLESLLQEPHIEAVLASDSLMEDLRSVGLHNVDAFLALSEDDNKNIMAAQVASNIFHVGNVICCVTDPGRQEFYSQMGINVVCPTILLAGTIKSSLKGSPAPRAVP